MNKHDAITGLGLSCAVPGCPSARNRHQVLCHRHYATVLPPVLWRAPRSEQLAAIMFIEADPVLHTGGPESSDVFAEGWRPGKGVRRKAVAKAVREGVPVERALDQIIDSIRRRQTANIIKQRRDETEVAELRQALRGEHQAVRRIVDALEHAA